MGSMNDLYSVMNNLVSFSNGGQAYVEGLNDKTIIADMKLQGKKGQITNVNTAKIPEGKSEKESAQLEKVSKDDVIGTKKSFNEIESPPNIASTNARYGDDETYTERNYIHNHIQNSKNNRIHIIHDYEDDDMSVRRSGISHFLE